MKKHIIIGIGEILWDMLPEGKVLGGAPANFAWHAQQLGGASSVISAIGNDALGHEIIDIVNHRLLNNCMSVSNHPTGTVGVELEKGIPRYTIHEKVAWDDIRLTQHAREVLLQADAICFGSLAQRHETSRHAIQQALSCVPEKCLKVFDINLRQYWYSEKVILDSLQKADILKINDEELAIVAEICGFKGAEEDICRSILSQYQLNLLVLTKGSVGSLLLTHNNLSYLETPKVNVADTVGAGDSFTAAIVMGWLKGCPLLSIHRQAVAISAYVCTQKGATPIIPYYMTV